MLTAERILMKYHQRNYAHTQLANITLQPTLRIRHLRVMVLCRGMKCAGAAKLRVAFTYLLCSLACLL